MAIHPFFATDDKPRVSTPAAPPPEVLTPAEVAVLAGVTERSVFNAYQRGQLTRVDTRDGVRYERASAEAWAASRVKHPAPLLNIGRAVAAAVQAYLSEVKRAVIGANETDDLVDRIAGSIAPMYDALESVAKDVEQLKSAPRKGR